MANQKTRYISIKSEDGVEGRILNESLPAWERNGWTVVDDGSSESGQEPESEDAPVQKAVVESERGGTNEGEVQ